MQATSEAMSSAPEVFLGRQPILDRDQQLLAYELLFRGSSKNAAGTLECQTLATATVIANAFTQLAIGDALGPYRAFIKVDQDFLFSDLLEALPRKAVVLEILQTVQATPEVIERCRQLQVAGFTLAVVEDLSKLSAAECALLELAAVIKIDVQQADTAKLRDFIARQRALGKLLLAEKIENLEQMQICHQLGFNLFQGYYFAKPTVIGGKRLNASEGALLRLLGMIVEDADTQQIEQAFKQDPGLTLNLLRLTNSAASGVSTHITSLRHAITLLGRRQLQRWLQLLLYTAPQGNTPAVSPLLQLAAIRGRLMELLAEPVAPHDREFADHAFMVGIMSLMPTLLGVSIDDILIQLPVALRIKLALSERNGQLGDLLNLVESTENQDPAASQEALEALPALDAAKLALCMTQAMAWGNQLGQAKD